MLIVVMFRVVHNIDDPSELRFEKVFPLAQDNADAESAVAKVAEILPLYFTNSGDFQIALDVADFRFEAYDSKTGEWRRGWFGAKKKEDA